MFLAILFLLPSAGFPGGLTAKENERLKLICGAHHLHGGPVLKSMNGYTVWKVGRNEIPWIAAVSFTHEEINWTHYCTAVQISSRHILTAAHCVVEDSADRKHFCKVTDDGKNINPKLLANLYTKIAPQNFTVYINSSCELPELCGSEQYLLSITKPPRIHEDYNPCTADNDLALIELDRDIPPKVGTPVCMPDKDEHLRLLLIAVGYVIEPYHPNPADSIFNRLQAINISSELVAEKGWKLKAVHVNKSVYSGDSGAPLVQLNHEGKYSLVGISSTGKDCEEVVRRAPLSTFIDVRKYIDWICSHTGVCPVEQLPPHNGHLESSSERTRTLTVIPTKLPEEDTR